MADHENLHGWENAHKLLLEALMIKGTLKLSNTDKGWCKYHKECHVSVSSVLASVLMIS